MLLILSLSSACGSASGDDSAARRERETGFRGILLPTPIAKADFTLMDTEYRPFRFREETDGHLTLLFFGYTNCPDICPVHMANLGAVLEDFPYAQRSRVKVVFVTTDPERDTPERLRAWLDDINASFIGLVGPLDEVNRIQQAFNLPAAIRDPVTRAKGDYLVGHSAQLLAFTPDNVGRVTYPFGTRQADWLQDLPRLLEHDWTQR